MRGLRHQAKKLVTAAIVANFFLAAAAPTLSNAQAPQQTTAPTAVTTAPAAATTAPAAATTAPAAVTTAPSAATTAPAAVTTAPSAATTAPAAVTTAPAAVTTAPSAAKTAASAPMQPKPTTTVRPVKRVRKAAAVPHPVASISTLPPTPPILRGATINRFLPLLTDRGQPVKPGTVVAVDNDLFFLDPTTLWVAPNAVSQLGTAKQLVLTPCGPGKPVIGKTPMQEFSNMIYSPGRRSLAILDKSGDIFEFFPKDKTWQVLRPNSPLGSPDPEYIDMSVSGKNVLLLDPERNQIWRYPATSSRYFIEKMPWRLHPGDISVAEGIAIAYDGTTWVLKKSGKISRFAAHPDAGMAKQLPFQWHPPADIRPSRMYTGGGMPLFIVERENNRILTVNKETGATCAYVVPADIDLRGIFPASDGFLAVAGSSLLVRSLNQPDSITLKPTTRRVDTRLAGLVMPLKGAVLPRHPGVWPGARRLYRYGVHKGTDFFCDAGPISMGTPVYAADAGKVFRADADFTDMNATKYSSVISECHHMHMSSETNENLLRGCQVWIDHGNGLITKYAHLDRIRPGLKSGMKVGRGELIGFVGVSGTGENLPGRAKHPHLHFEVWLDGRYLGFGLTPPETIEMYEDIFGTASRNRTGRGVRRA